MSNFFCEAGEDDCDCKIPGYGKVTGAGQASPQQKLDWLKQCIEKGLTPKTRDMHLFQIAKLKAKHPELADEDGDSTAVPEEPKATEGEHWFAHPWPGTFCKDGKEDCHCLITENPDVVVDFDLRRAWLADAYHDAGNQSSAKWPKAHKHYKNLMYAWEQFHTTAGKLYLHHGKYIGKFEALLAAATPEVLTDEEKEIDVALEKQMKLIAKAKGKGKEKVITIHDLISAAVNRDEGLPLILEVSEEQRIVQEITVDDNGIHFVLDEWDDMPKVKT